MILRPFPVALGGLLMAGLLHAQGPSAATNAPAKWKWEQMDQGPFFTSNVEFSKTNVALKAVTLRLSEGTHREAAAVAFDTMTLRWAGAWVGGFLHLPKGRDGMEGVPQPWGNVAWTTTNGPGWGRGNDLKDPRGSVNERLPDAWGRWRGVHRQGDQVTLDYTVGAARVLEQVDFRHVAGAPVFSRILQFDRAVTNQSLVLAWLPRGEVVTGSRFAYVRDPVSKRHVAARVDGADPVGWVVGGDGTLVVHFQRVEANRPVRIDLTQGESEPRAVVGFPDDSKDLTSTVNSFFETPTRSRTVAYPVPDDLRPRLAPRAGSGGDTFTTQGRLATSGGDGPYVVDTVPLPESTPSQSWMRLSGLDFFSDPTQAAVCSVSGDVWRVSGLDASLGKVLWKRIASGLFQPLGLRIVDDVVYVTCRDGIVRLRDEDGDGEVDFYENFNNDVTITPHYHEFCLGLETDAAGDFYFNKGGNLGEARIPHQGTLNRVSRDGSRLEVVATGLRAPNGLSVGPRGEITTSDNEGNWVPASRVNLMRPGGFYGHVFTAHRTPKPTGYDGPLFWLPKNVDNSSGGQVWVTSDRWGPFSGDLLHTSYGMSSLFKAFHETVDGVDQGGVVRFPLKFDSGVMRGRFNPGDGQLYLCGLVIWQSNGAQKGALHRVRYTGRPVNSVRHVAVRPDGVELQFTGELERSSVEDVANWSVERWNYRWTEKYGSPEFSVKDPERKGHDPVEVRSATWSAGGRVRLVLSEVGPVMQQRIKFALKDAAGAPLEQEVWHTIHRVPKAP